MEKPESQSSETSKADGQSSSTTFPTAKIKEMTLMRIKEHPRYGTFGVLIDEDKGVPVGVTLERVWKNNKENESCIPVGEYICKRYSSERYPGTFQVTDVKGRTGILFHKGNIDDHSSGCIILGEMYDPVWDNETKTWDYGVLASGRAFGEFMKILKDVSEFRLTIWRIDLRYRI